MQTVLIFAERMLPFTQTFIPMQVNALQRYRPHYTGLIPARPCCELNAVPTLLTKHRSILSRIRRETYRLTGYAPIYHSLLRRTGAALVHAHFAEGASSAVAISNALRIPMILHLRGLLPRRPPTLAALLCTWACASSTR
jgi:colanic acid/amylovoran biosynthesis glycosyltransferase